MEITVKFDKVFESIPQVLISNEIFDLGAQAPTNFYLEIVDVQLTHFVYKVTCDQAKPLYNFKARWLAIVDPETLVMYQTISTPNLLVDPDQAQKQVRRIQVEEISFEEPFAEPPNVAAYIVGLATRQSNFLQVFVNVIETTVAGCKIAI